MLSKVTWVSHSSISDFIKCPRLYYLRNVYKNPQTHRKMTLMTPPLALGQAVHDSIEMISNLPADQRLATSLLERLEIAWKKVSGELGGFSSGGEEELYRQRGVNMLDRLQNNPGILLKKAVKIRPKDADGKDSDFDLPRYLISEEDGIMLCGKVDWLEYDEDDNAVHIVDFKTGKNEEDENSLQLPIYVLLTKHGQKYKVKKVSYWYLENEDHPREMLMPNDEECTLRVLEIARKIKQNRAENNLTCPKGGCFACRPYEGILQGKGKMVGVSGTNQDIFILGT